MKKTQCYIGAPNGVVLCIDAVSGWQWTGRFYHRYSRDATEVHSAEELTFALERLFDDLNFPHPTTNSRSFRGQKRETRRPAERNRPAERKGIVSDDELLSRHGDLGSFIIRVQHRQNSSWQGRITWMDQDKTVYFRSVWEMIQLIDSALDTVSAPEDRRQPDWQTDQA